VGVQPIPTIDDKQVEGDEALFMNARVDYYKAGCPEGAGRSPSCVPESSMLRRAGQLETGDDVGWAD
jgi:hypothetical protein